MRPKVAFARGGRCDENVEMTLRLIESEIELRDKPDVSVKVNLVSTTYHFFDLC